jgi:membrane dipeptidase
MISRRQFTKTLGGAVTLTAIRPDALWSGEPTATATPVSASPGAAELYRKVFVLDGNVLGAIGFPISNHDPVGVTKRIVGSGVNVVKSTLGGAQGNFEEAVAAIANAELLMEKQPEAFSKCSARPISIARRTKGSSASFIRSNRRTRSRTRSTESSYFAVSACA